MISSLPKSILFLFHFMHFILLQYSNGYMDKPFPSFACSICGPSSLLSNLSKTTVSYFQARDFKRNPVPLYFLSLFFFLATNDKAILRDEQNGNIKWSRFLNQYMERSYLLYEQEVSLYFLQSLIEAHRNRGIHQRCFGFSSRPLQ